MDEPEAQPGILTDALVREAVSLIGTVVIIWALSGAGRDAVRMIRARIRARIRAKSDRTETVIREFAAEISRWDHEQAAQPDRRPGGGPCGCTG